jgi:hypothetical protein
VADLELAETDDLLNEVFSRFDHACFIGMREQEYGEKTHGFIRKWKGNSHACSGLCQDLSLLILTAFIDRNELVEDEDEEL